MWYTLPPVPVLQVQVHHNMANEYTFDPTQAFASGGLTLDYAPPTTSASIVAVPGTAPARTSNTSSNNSGSSNLPSTANVNQVVQSNGRNYRWDGKQWIDSGPINGSSGGSSSVNDLIKSYTDSVTSMVNPLKPYSEVNPFSFDEALAEQSATAEYDPYYKQLLSDYTQQTQRTLSRSAEDTKTTLENLAAGKEYYTGEQRRALDASIKSTNEGYAGRGLFESGAKKDDLNKINTEYAATTGEYNREYLANVQQAQTGQQRTAEDVNTASDQYTRDVGQQEKTAIAGQVQQLKSEALAEYQAGEQTYYQANNYL